MWTVTVFQGDFGALDWCGDHAPSFSVPSHASGRIHVNHAHNAIPGSDTP